MVGYNHEQGFITIYAHIASYNTSLKKHVKWYWKVVGDIICIGQYACSLYRDLTNNHMIITKFKEAIDRITFWENWYSCILFKFEAYVRKNQ